MDIGWSSVKEVFFVIGSVAGIVAFLRPLFEAKLQRDSVRVDRIKTLVSEQRLVELEDRISASREVPYEDFAPFDQLAHERRTNQEVVRFTGPTGKHLARELDALLASYAKLREYIQVNKWVPRTEEIDGVEYQSWVFRKSAFEDRDEVMNDDYVKHLDQAAEQAVQMKRAYQRFQVVAELHLFEVLVARWLLPRRFKAHGLSQ
jgi:hypothetical protein